MDGRLAGDLQIASVIVDARLYGPADSHSNEGWGLFSPIGQDHQWVHRPFPEKVLLVRLGSEYLTLCVH